MKKVLSLIAAAALVAAASTAGATIVGSAHDLSSGSGGTLKSQNTAEICIFCHTPHNATIAVPLWNRNNPAGTNFKLYSSGTMKLTYGALKASQGFTSDSISLFCMSCHDGTTGLGNINNQPGDGTLTSTSLFTNAAAGTQANITGPANLGTNLSTTHPVNFNVVSGTDTAIYTFAGNYIGNGLTNKLPLFNSARGTTSLECASCHAVHDPTNTPFLRTTNAGSKLCLACHIK